MPRQIRLAIFDLDGTLTTVESLWKYLHDAFKTWDDGKAAAQRYWKGEISYKDWAEIDAKSWAGIPVDAVMGVLSQIPYTKGARKVFSCLRDRRVKTAIVSAGLSILANKMARELGADLAIANDLEIRQGKLTGRIYVKVSVTEKAGIAKDIATQFKIPLQQTALVGDRANDLTLDDCLKIAFRPRDDVARSRADVVIDGDDLSTVLNYLAPG
jgi:phosphoserine phosphatase